MKKLILLTQAAVLMMSENRNIIVAMRKVWRAWRKLGLNGFIQFSREYIASRRPPANYRHWLKMFSDLDSEDIKIIRQRIVKMKSRPLISIIMPVYDPPEKWLRRAIESVRAQLYPHWELCIADDCSTESYVRKVLEHYSDVDNRIKINWRKTNGHISVSSNSALELASGDFLALLDHDDELAPHALYMVAAALERNPSLDLIYSDEDKIDERGQRFDPYFKPDWNPDLFRGQNMVCHLAVYRTEVLRAVGGFREGFEGSQDWDLALRVTERISASNICHLPYVLYHWRAIANSTATNLSAKPYAITAAVAALNEHLVRTKCHGSVEPLEGGHLRVRFSISVPFPLVSIIIPTRNGVHLLRQCIESIRSRSSYPNYEILVVDNQSDDPAALGYLTEIEENGIARVLRYDFPFNYSAINNFAAREAKGSFLCLLNNDIEVISSGWLEEMVSHASRPDVGAVGAMLYYPNDLIQHAGVVLGMGGVAGHAYGRSPRGTPGYMNRARLVQNIGAVTGACLLVRASIFREVGGLDAENLPVAFNDVDFCIRVAQCGYRNLWTPFAELYHHESATRGSDETADNKPRFRREHEYMKARWGDLLQRDPAFNPNLSLDRAWPQLATPPREAKPWRV